MTAAGSTGPSVAAREEAKMTPVHCWEGGPLTDDGCPTTCMLEDEHSGPHEWTRDDEITIQFASGGAQR
jgi:hypothetical protein